MFKHEKLEVWREAIELTCRVYDATKGFPADERFGLTSQLRRSANSIAANIAEGCGRGSDRDYVRFLEIGYGSLMETVSHLEVARRMTFLDEARFQQLYEQAGRVGRMLSGLRKSLGHTES